MQCLINKIYIDYTSPQIQELLGYAKSLKSQTIWRQSTLIRDFITSRITPCPQDSQLWLKKSNALQQLSHIRLSEFFKIKCSDSSAINILLALCLEELGHSLTIEHGMLKISQEESQHLGVLCSHLDSLSSDAFFIDAYHPGLHAQLYCKSNQFYAKNTLTSSTPAVHESGNFLPSSFTPIMKYKISGNYLRPVKSHLQNVIL